ncbi:MAG: hypothetical protein J5548_13095 [Prevotella sp.]|nr:hypothetical protein [Prevotella sp.]
MKIAKLLVLCAVLLFGSNAARAVSSNVWTPPSVSEFATMEEGAIYYFYLPDCELFFTEGNAWGTQASAGPTGLKVRIDPVEGKTGVYTLTDFSKVKNNWLMWWFVDDGVYMYVDYNGQADYLWEITTLSNNTYRFSPSAENPNANNNTLFVGLNRTENPDNTVLTANNTADGGAYINWKLVPEAAGDAYYDYCKVYDAAMQLKDLLDEAEEINASVADQIAVYNNTNSTLEELNAAIEDTKAAIEARKQEIAQEQYASATPSNPVDVTSLFIQNPTFANNNLSGWAGSGWAANGGKENAERYNMNYDTYQELEGLREGVYKFSANAFYRAGNAQPAYDNYKAGNKESKYAKLYATAGDNDMESSIKSPFSASLSAQMTTGSWASATDTEANMTFWIPNNMVAADEFFKAGHCNDNEVYMYVGSDGTLKVGARKSTTIGGDWSIFDDFALTYYGKGSDAIIFLRTAYLDALEVLDLTGVIYTKSYLTAYNTGVSSLRSANTVEKIYTAMEAIKTAKDNLDTNIDLWKQLAELRDKALEAANATDYQASYRNKCKTWANTDYPSLVNERALSNEELEAEIAKVQAMIDEVYRHPGADEVDMTNLMVNPGFEDGFNGWTKEAAGGGNVNIGGNNANHCYEAWNNANFDIYQIIQNAPKGVYEISVQGFYRYGRGNYTAYLNGEPYTTKEGCPVFVYLNTNATPFTNVYGDPVQITDESFYGSGFESQTLADGTVLYFPNTMDNAAVAFSNGMYTQSAFGLVANDGDPMRIGVKGCTNQLNDSWSIWDNFKITWCGFKADVVKPILQEAIAEAEASLNSPIGSDIIATLQAAINQGKAVVNGTDGEAMFAALTALWDLKDAVNESKALFATLAAANEELATAISGAVASSDIVSEANTLNSTITNGIANHSYANSDVEGLIQDINTMIHRLGIPQNMGEATASNPVECTTIIINPAYDNANDNGWNGNAAINGTSLNAEKYNTTFNYFQDLSGLPAGKYRVVLQGFYRAGLADNDYNTYVEDPTANNNAVLYATVGEKTTSSSLKRLASEAQTMESLTDGWVWASEANNLAVPNSMVAAGEAFNTFNATGTERLYAGNTVEAVVGNDGKLTIGLRKDVQIDRDWTIWDNWQLFYLGNDNVFIGDANGDGQVNITDVTILVDYVLSHNEEFINLTNADINEDGDWNITDVTLLVNIILNTN